MAALSELLVRIGLDPSKFNAGLDDVNRKLNMLDKEAQTAFSGFDKLGQRLTNLGAGLTAGLTVPIAGLGVASARAFEGFEQSLNRVSAVGEIAGRDIEKLKAQAIDLGAKTKFSARQAADGMGELAAAGFRTTDIMKAMPAVLDLAASGQLEVGRAAEIASNLMAGFGIPAEGVSKAVDVVAKAAASGSLSVEDMGLTFKYVGPIATSAGLSFEETAAAVTLLSNAGIKGEQAGTTLRGAIAKLLDPSREAAGAMERLGVVATDSNGKLLPLSDIIEQLGRSGATTGDIFKIFGQESASGIAALVATGAPALRQMTGELQNSDGAAQKMAQTLQAGLPGALERMSGSVETAGITIGEVLAPYIVQLAGYVESAANKLAEFVRWFRTLPQPIQASALAIAAMAAAVGPLLLAAGQVAQVLVSINTALPFLQTGLSSVAGVASSLLVPALVATAAAVVGMQLYDTASALGEVYTSLTYTGSAAAANKGWFDQLRDAIFGTHEAAQNASASGSVLAGSAKAAGEATSYWADVTGKLQAAWARFSWTDLLTPLGPLRQKLLDVADAIKAIRGVFPEMEKAGSDALGKLSTANKNWARTQAEAAMRVHDAQKNTAKAAESQQKLAGEVKKGTAESKSQAQIARELGRRNEDLHETYRQLEAQHKKNIAEIVKWRLEHQTLESRTPQYISATDDLNAAIARIGATAASVGSGIATFGQILDREMKQAAATPVAVEEAYRRLGVTSSAELQRQASEARSAYETIKASGEASARDIDAAWVKMERARIDAAKAAGKEIPAEAERALAQIEERLGTHTKTTQGKWSDWSNQVSTIITDLGRDLSKALWDGEKSWGEKGMAMLKNLGEGVTRMFVEPAMKAIGDLVGGVLADLIGGKGFGGVIDRLKDVGKMITDMFGGGTTLGQINNAQREVGTQVATGSLGGSTGGGGAANVASAVGSVVGAISSVISNFQQAKMETSLNAIEHNTRYSMMFLGERGDGGILGQMFRVAHALEFGTVVQVLEQIRNQVLDWMAPIGEASVDIAGQMVWAVRRLDQIGNDVMYGSAADRDANALLRELIDVTKSAGRAIVVNVYGTSTQSPQQVGNAIARAVSLQLG